MDNHKNTRQQRRLSEGLCNHIKRYVDKRREEEMQMNQPEGKVYAETNAQIFQLIGRKEMEVVYVDILCAWLEVKHKQIHRV